jgi:hypothetical protein
MAITNRHGAENFYKLTSSARLESKSGLGSFVANTNELRESLPHIIEKYSIRSIIDCPCGDWNWMRLVSLERVDYLGLDIVKELIDENMLLYQRPGIRFALHDMIIDPLPKADLILCRDLLFHLSLEQIEACLRNVRESGSRFILTTTFPWIKENLELSNQELAEQWGWRMINAECSPINLGNPLEIIKENGRCKYREVRLYQIDD